VIITGTVSKINWKYSILWNFSSELFGFALSYVYFTKLKYSNVEAIP